MSRRMGRIQACPCVLEVVDRTAMVAAIVEHARQLEAGIFRSDHRHAGYRFRIETADDRRATRIRPG